jgi:stage V sporulation protein SpoVS
MTDKAPAKKAPVSKPKPIEEKPEPGKVWLCIWKDASGDFRASGVGAVRSEAKKIAEKARRRYERENGIDLVTYVMAKVDVSQVTA